MSHDHIMNISKLIVVIANCITYSKQRNPIEISRISCKLVHLHSQTFSISVLLLYELKVVFLLPPPPWFDFSVLEDVHIHILSKGFSSIVTILYNKIFIFYQYLYSFDVYKGKTFRRFQFNSKLFYRNISCTNG